MNAKMFVVSGKDPSDSVMPQLMLSFSLLLKLTKKKGYTFGKKEENKI